MGRRVVLGLVVAAVLATSAYGRVNTPHAQWVANANSACTWAGAERLKLGSNTGTTAQWLYVFPRLTALQVEEVRRIQEVAPAPGDRMLVRGLINTYWLKDIAEERNAYSFLKAGNMAAFKNSLNRVFWYEQQEDVLLRALGTKCRQI